MYLRKSEEGFVLVLSLLLLVIMTTIGAGLIFTASNQAKQSSSWGNYQQAFYAAETGQEDAISWLEEKIYVEGKIPEELGNKKELCSTIFNKSEINYVETDNKNNANLHIGYDDNNDLNDLDSNVKKGSYTYKYYIEKADTTGVTNVREGEKVTMGDPYESATPTLEEKYKVYICAIGPNNEESILETILSAMIGSN